MQAEVLEYLVDWTYSGCIRQQGCVALRYQIGGKSPEASERSRRQKACTQEAVSPRSRKDIGKWQLSQVTQRTEAGNRFLEGFDREHLAAGRMKNCIICSLLDDAWILNFIIATEYKEKEEASVGKETFVTSKAKCIWISKKGIKRIANNVVRRNCT